MKLLLKLYAVLFATLLFPACGEDEYTYPDLITEMSCLKTDSEGIGIQIITDEGMVWNLQKGNQPKDLTADSVYRVVSRFAPINVSEAKVYFLNFAIARKCKHFLRLCKKIVEYHGFI